MSDDAMKAEELARLRARIEAADKLAEITQQAARDARDVFSEYRTAREAIDYMEQLIYAARQERNAAEDQERELAEELRTVKAERDALAEVEKLYHAQLEPRSGPETSAEAEDRICTCGAGHGSLEGHVGWCDWLAYLALHPAPAAAEASPLAEVQALREQVERLREGEARLSRLLNENERAEAAEAEVEKLEAQVAKLTEALTDLDKAASEVARRGAVTGPQWSRLTIASLKSRAALSTVKQEAGG